MNKNIIYLYCGGAVLAYLAYQQISKSLSGTLASSDLVQGILNPIDSLGAVVKAATGQDVVVNTSGVQLTDNYKWYLEGYGGIDKYLAMKKTGTFNGLPYDNSKDYKTLYQQTHGGVNVLIDVLMYPSNKIASTVSDWFK
jgi:hypothetical protein